MNRLVRNVESHIAIEDSRVFLDGGVNGVAWKCCLAVSFTHGVERFDIGDIADLAAELVHLTADNREVAVAFVAGIPNARNEAVLLGGGDRVAVPSGASFEMLLEIVAGESVKAFDGTHFTNHDRDTLVEKAGLEAAEQIVDGSLGAECGAGAGVRGIVTRSLVFPVVEHLAPVFVSACHERELVGVEVDFGHGVAVASRVGRVLFGEERGLVDFGTRGLHDHDAGRIVAAGRTHGFDACFVELLEDGHALGVECPLAVVGTAVPRVVHARFVCGCENQVLVIFGELGGNLLPVRFLLGGNCCCGAVHKTCLVVTFTVKDVVFEPAFVPVAVQNRVHAVIDDEIDDRLDGIEPTGIDCAVRGMAVPGARNSHGVETGVLDGFHVGCVRERVAPSGRIPRNFHRVADIVTETHLWENFGCLGERKCRCCCQEDRAGGDAEGVESHVEDSYCDLLWVSCS